MSDSVRRGLASASVGGTGVVLGDRDPTQLTHGSGLGLWLVKWILDAIDGTFEVDDRVDGSGSVVTLRLPTA